MAALDPQKPYVRCIACRHEQPLGNFRRLKDEPLLYSDFCDACEQRYGPGALYLDENYGYVVDPKARNFVLHGDPASGTLDREVASARDEAQRELARRELMRRRLVYYVTQFRRDYKAGWVHQDICRRLERFVERVERRESPRLMLFMPPRHGKSTLVSDEFQSWVLGHHPDWEVISASYAVSLPIGFSRRIRDRIDSKEYQAIFPRTRVRSDSRGVEEWLTTEGGRFRAAGVEGGITGTGCRILSIDDPIKDYQEAQSETVRENAYNWYTTTARTRLEPGGGVLITQTRWHDADLAGRLLSDRDLLIEAGVPRDEIDDWEVVSYPALAEGDEYLFSDGSIQVSPPVVPEDARLLRREGEALHPERYSARELRTIRNGTPRVQWNALYQQNPVPDTGEYFTTEMMRYYGGLVGVREEYTIFSAWDLAIGLKNHNDWTVGTVGALNANGDLFVLDMVRGRLKANDIVNAIIGLWKKWPQMQLVGLEDGQIRKTMAPLLETAITTEHATFSLDESLKPTTDKLARARPLQQRMQMGQLLFPIGQPWSDKAQQELLRFPSGVHDDIVDSLAWLARMALHIGPPAGRASHRRARRTSWRNELGRFTVGTATDFMTA